MTARASRDQRESLLFERRKKNSRPESERGKQAKAFASVEFDETHSINGTVVLVIDAMLVADVSQACKASEICSTGTTRSAVYVWFGVLPERKTPEE